MKKTILILIAFLLGSVAMAQNKTVIQAGVSVSNNVFTQDLEIGTTDGKNTISLIGTTFEAPSQRQYQAGVKFARKVLVSNSISVSPSADVKVRLNKGPKSLVFSPGASVNLDLTKGVALSVAVSSPITENTTLVTPIRLKGGVGVAVTL